MRGYLFAGASILLVTFAQLAMKWGMVQLPGPGHWLDPGPQLAHYLVPLSLVAAGIAAYATSLGCWMAALHSLPLSKAYPLLSLSYGLVYLLAGVLPWLQEGYSVTRSLGVVLIVAGVILVNGRKPSEPGSPG